MAETSDPVRFVKMHGAGNDFVVLDLRRGAQPCSAARAAALADRHTGIGCDQLIALLPPRQAGADVFMQIANADGSEAGACGNATRCIADLLADELGRDDLVIETISGLLPALRVAPGLVRVEMGRPGLDWQHIPLSRAEDTLHLPLPGDPAAASMGNPHATFFVEDLEAEPIFVRGPIVQANPLFARGVNVGFAQVLSPNAMRLRVYERGAGLTRACGSGACAAMVNAYRRGFCASEVEVRMDGGSVTVAWDGAGAVHMTGPATRSFSGVFTGALPA